jgi:hypothetical protein
MMGINLGTFILILLKMIYFLNLQDMIFDIYINKTYLLKARAQGKYSMIWNVNDPLEI